MVNKIYNLFISSENRSSYEKTYDFTIYFATDEIITLKNNEYLNVNVVSFSMLNSMYNVNQYTGNNIFTLEEYTLGNTLTSSTNIVIPYGNYDVLSLRDTLNTLLSNKIDISYNNATNTYTFTKLNNLVQYKIIPLKCTKLLGLSTTTDISDVGVKGSFINMVDYQQVILKSPTFKFENCSLDNLQYKNNYLASSDFLFWFNKQDIEPFKTINYRNEDCNTNFNYNLLNRYINMINFQIVNEYDEHIVDCPDYLLQVQMSVTERNEDIYNILGIQIVRVLSEIHFVLLNIVNIFRVYFKI